MASRAAEIEKIRSSIAAYEGDGVVRSALAKSALAKIARSKASLEALAEMHLTDVKLKKLIESFAMAVQLKRDFRLILAQEAAALTRGKQLMKAVSDLRDFVNETAAQTPDGVRATIALREADKRLYLRALLGIEDMVGMRDRIARETPIRIGATRKTSANKAEENAAIGWLAASIQRITSRPWISQSAILAGILFGISKLTEDRLRRALRNYTERKWRQPLFYKM